MASSKSLFLLLCALLALVLILSAEASTSLGESEKTDEVEDQYGGSGLPAGEYPDGHKWHKWHKWHKGHKGHCRHGCGHFHRPPHCHHKFCHPKKPHEAQSEDDTQN